MPGLPDNPVLEFFAALAPNSNNKNGGDLYETVTLLWLKYYYGLSSPKFFTWFTTFTGIDTILIYYTGREELVCPRQIKAIS